MVTSTNVLNLTVNVNTLGDVGGLLLNGANDVAGLVVNAFGDVVVADVFNGIANNLLVVDFSLDEKIFREVEKKKRIQSTLVVISPKIMTIPVLAAVSQPTRDSGS